MLVKSRMSISEILTKTMSSAFGRRVYTRPPRKVTQMKYPFLTDSHIFDDHQQAYQELVSLAKQVAKQQRNEDKLQPIEILQTKFERERNEYCEAATHTNGHDQHFIHLLSEAADLVYYSAQLIHQCAKAECASGYTVESMLFSYGIDADQAITAALVKYRLRARAPHSKNFAAENEAIRQAVGLM